MKKSIMGALTEINNKKNRILPVQPIAGDIIILDYTEPTDVIFNGKLLISKVVHDYKNILKKITKDGQFEESGECEVDINCTEGNDWQNEKQSVCRILRLMYYHSGALINNIDNDGTPYVLASQHSFQNEIQANYSVFVFNYESPSCDGSDGSTSQSISSSTLVASWECDYWTNVGTDFALVELSSEPPASYFPYYSGWYRNNSYPSGGTCIHHPMGDVKKISVEEDQLASTYYRQNINFLSTDHWMVIDWDVGATEHGSSGAPLYNEDHRIIGQLHGGYAACDGSDDNGEPDWFGKISKSWNGDGEDTTRLKDWLDPDGTDTNEIPGLRFYHNGTIDATFPLNGDIVKLKNIDIDSGSDITITFNNKFETEGTFTVPEGATIEISP